MLAIFPPLKQEAVSLAKTEDVPESAARKLTEIAYSRGSADNITCIVVQFHHDKTGGWDGGQLIKDSLLQASIIILQAEWGFSQIYYFCSNC